MEKAEKLANLSPHRHKLGAIIARQGKIIGKGWNKVDRGVSLYEGYWKGSCHAEISALLDAKCDVAGSSIFVVRRNRRLSAPCSTCRAILQEAGIKRAYYFNDGEIVKEKL